MTVEFEEIGHSGGKITFTIVTGEDGKRSFQIGMSSDRPVPMVWIAVYAISQGVPVETIRLGGIGQPWNPPPFPGCLPVFIASDTQGKFGHTCPGCGGYWRSGPFPNLCPYCRISAPSHQFLSQAQLRYLKQYCDVLTDSLETVESGEIVVDMDVVADAVGKNGEKPAFYVSEESQQHKFTCAACDEFNDILGRFGYCSLCGTRNDLADFGGKTVPSIRERLNSGDTPEDCVRSGVSSFESFISAVARELSRLVPLSKRRENRLTSQRFHNVEEVARVFKEWFDIDIRDGIAEEEWSFVVRMFHRRHVYEHSGGVVDQKYLNDSGDTTVRLRQRIRETKEDAHRLLGVLTRMTRNVHSGFHELIPPIPEPISTFDDKKARMERHRQKNG